MIPGEVWHRSRAPVASHDTLEQALQIHWGLTATLTPLYGERDLNVRLDTPGGETWLLKLAHPDTGRRRLDFEQAVLDGLDTRRASPAAPTLVPSRDGESLVPITLDGAVRTHLRLLSWLPGEPLDPERAGPETLEALGSAIARLNEALAACAPRDTRALPDALPWDLRNTADLAPLLDACPPLVPAEAIRRTLEAFRRNVEPALRALPAQVIHNDLNPDNLRCDPGRPGAAPGVIDFGDMVVAPVVCDLAIACAYLVGRAPDTCLDRVVAVLRGFDRVRSIREAEWALLPILLECRLCQSLLIQGARVGDGHPDAEALETNLEGHGRRLLALQALGRDRAGWLKAAVISRTSGNLNG
ncbi:MAG: phosphotransferase [Xanthomonadales bacterium]|nr:phosphotransferase [Xanthomonadales bacterium]